VFDPRIADYFRWDFRVPAEMMALIQDGYPLGPVPGVDLGIEP
jgi:hypothetical protein